MTSASSTTEDHKRLLNEYLIERVRAGISGRDGKTLVGLSPSRHIFAGVLQPPRQADIRAAKEGKSSGDAPVGSALGLDFRVQPNNPKGPVRLRIRARWSLYYSVFPAWRDVCNLNDSLRKVSASTFSDKDVSVPSDATEVVTSDATAEAEVDTDELPEADEPGDVGASGSSGRIILPLTWQRYDVCPEPLSIDLEVCDFKQCTISKLEFAEAIQKARAAMLDDPNIWCHLGEPSQRERELGDVSKCSDQSTYLKVLNSVKGEAVVPPNWEVNLQAQASLDASKPGAVRIRLLLANTTSEAGEDVADPKLQERSLLDAGLIVEIEGGVLEPFEFLLAPKDYRSNPLLPAKGINCTANWSNTSPHRLETETLPIFRQPLYRTKEGLDVSFDCLDVDDPIPVLEELAKHMDSYLEEWDRFLKSGEVLGWNQGERDSCKSDREAFAEEVIHFRFGINVLKRDKTLLRAFRLMNRTFTQIGKRGGGKIRAWRLFQIGFIVSQLMCLAVRELGEEEDDEYARNLRAQLEEVGVLWFPTGGGKTEAYLGLIATALLHDRLRGKTRGVSAWMRFPLRMLSLQQLERLARVIAALNELREREPALQVGDPYAIGYYVGDTNTPNSISKDEMARFEQNANLRAEKTLIRKCPFCNSRVEIKPLRTSWRLAHVCLNSACFSNTSKTLGAYLGSLPICIVDNEIYRYLPSVLVGTVDKMAIVGRNRYFAHLVRGVKQQCPKHGYTSYDQCIEFFAGCDLKKKDLAKLSVVKDPGPSLLIQDELHLLRAELGVFNGHYEGLLRYLGMRAYLPPKVLAATATIESYDTHAFHIYLSRSRRYPQPAWEQGESFYATSKPLQFRRTFVGVLGHTRGIQEPALRLLTLYQGEIRRLQSKPREAALIMDCEGLEDKDILETLRLYDLSVCYVNRKSIGGSIIDKLGQVSRTLAMDNLGEVKGQLLTGDQSIEDVGATLDRIEQERMDTGQPRLDVVVATNLISHGVDLERINMMTVCGMPSHYAEYVQSSSRAARSHPGCVFVCFKARDPRETSQYEFFPAMHEHMDRLIEAVAVNRFASFAPYKTVPGLLAGVLLCEFSPELYGSKIKRPLDHVPTLRIALGKEPGSSHGESHCINEADLRQAIERIIGVDTVRHPASKAQIEHLRNRVQDVFDDQIAAIGRTLETKLKDVLNPITSFRDVDEGIDFGSNDSANLVLRLRAR